MNKPMNKKENIILLICALIIISSIVSFFIIRALNITSSSFKFNEHLNETLLTIAPDSDKNEAYSISLKEMSYYILVSEASVNHTASLYNPDNINSYWNLYISHTFVKTIAKNTCMDMFIRDNIYYLEAQKNNFSLNSSEQALALDEATYIYQNLTGIQVDATSLTLEDLYQIRCKIDLTAKYINQLMSQYNYTSEALNVDGSYYTSVYDTYDIVISELWDNITLGNITIDR